MTELNQLIAQIKRHCLPQECIMLEQMEQDIDYYLITGYSVYQAYQLCGKEWVTCLCRPATNETVRRLDALLWILTHARGWMDKNKAINDLLDRGVSQQELADYMGVRRSLIEEYLIRVSVPSKIVERAKANGSSFPVINDIATLPLANLIKNRLYDRALIIERRGYKKLTKEKMRWLKKLLHVEHFMALDAEKQWTVIERTVLNYENLIINKMKAEVKQQRLDYQLLKIK